MKMTEQDWLDACAVKLVKCQSLIILNGLLGDRSFTPEFDTLNRKWDALGGDVPAKARSALTDFYNKLKIRAKEIQR